MKKLIILITVLFSLFLSMAFAYDLSNIEDVFVKNGQITCYVVVADKGAGSDVLAQLDVINYLNKFTDGLASVHKLVSEIDDPYSRDIISLGNPCVNTITKDIMDYDGDCDFDEGLMKFYNKNGNVQLVIYGATDASTR